MTTLPTGQLIPSAGELIAFIKSVVNSGEFGPLKKDWWKPNDTVVICDSDSCIPLMYRASGSWLPIGPAYKDLRTKYRNGSQNVSFIGTRNNTGQNIQARIDVTGRLEWWDYYSDETYITSSDPVFVVDSVSITNFTNLQGDYLIEG